MFDNLDSNFMHLKSFKYSEMKAIALGPYRFTCNAEITNSVKKCI